VVRIDLTTGLVSSISHELPHVGQIAVHPTRPEMACVLGWAGGGTELVRLNLQSGKHATERNAFEGWLDAADTALPETVVFPTSHDEQAHGFFYAPNSQHFSAPQGTQPPLIVMVHGGPTAGAVPVWRPDVQFWTTRGFAVLDVNYRGSTGYGRTYRDRLRGQWGVLDVDDCVQGAQFLADQGRVDARKLFIRGGSAGGYTVLQALANHRVFAGGSCHYGVSDLEALVRDTHKFESHYDRFLIGPYPERRDLFLERSPIYAVDRIRTPVVFFQGLDDKVVPADQTERMAQTLREQGVDAEFHGYAGEQHGFRQAATIQHVLTTELAFLQRLLTASMSSNTK
jgi:dipeptidyl aminopeptidase/acylaminoacyl peptidase